MSERVVLEQRGATPHPTLFVGSNADEDIYSA
jgi:hypothetical protein